MRGGSKTRERFFTVFFMLAVTVVFISAVSALNLATADIVARNAGLFRKRAVLEAAGLDHSGSPEDVSALYDAAVSKEETADGASFFRVAGPGGGGKRALVFERSGAGLWGRIEAVVGVDETGAKLTGVTFLQHSETPGLGARVDEQWFKRQFAGKRRPLSRVAEGAQVTSDHEFNAITGATVTSKAVEVILNRTLEEAERKAKR